MCWLKTAFNTVIVGGATAIVAKVGSMVYPGAGIGIGMLIGSIIGLGLKNLLQK